MRIFPLRSWTAGCQEYKSYVCLQACFVAIRHWGTTFRCWASTVRRSPTLTWSAGPSLRSEVGHLQPQVQRIKSKVHGPFLHPADVMILQMSCFMLASDPCFEVASDPQRVSKVLVHFPFAVKPECNGVTGGAECDPAYYGPLAQKCAAAHGQLWNLRCAWAVCVRLACPTTRWNTCWTLNSKMKGSVWPGWI